MGGVGGPVSWGDCKKWEYHRIGLLFQHNIENFRFFNVVLSSKETSFIRGLRSQMPFPGNRIFPEKILEISRPELWEQPFPGPHSVYVSCLLTTLHFVSKADQSQRFFKSVFCYKDLFLLMFVVDVEFHPKLHFLTHQSNEPSGNNAYKAIPLLFTSTIHSPN